MSDFQHFLDESLDKISIWSLSETGPADTDYDIYKELREMVRKARKEKGLTQKQLAEKTGLSQANISNIEKGTTTPTVDSLKKIADALEMRLIISFEDREELI